MIAGAFGVQPDRAPHAAPVPARQPACRGVSSPRHHARTIVGSALHTTAEHHPERARSDRGLSPEPARSDHGTSSGAGSIRPEKALPCSSAERAQCCPVHLSLTHTRYRVRRSMRPWESARRRTGVRHRFPRSHGPSQEELTTQGLIFRKHVDAREPRGCHSRNASRRRSPAGVGQGGRRSQHESKGAARARAQHGARATG